MSLIRPAWPAPLSPSGEAPGTWGEGGEEGAAETAGVGRLAPELDRQRRPGELERAAECRQPVRQEGVDVQASEEVRAAIARRSTGTTGEARTSAKKSGVSLGGSIRITRHVHSGLEGVGLTAAVNERIVELGSSGAGGMAGPW